MITNLFDANFIIEIMNWVEIPGSVQNPILGERSRRDGVELFISATDLQAVELRGVRLP